MRYCLLDFNKFKKTPQNLIRQFRIKGNLHIIDNYNPDQSMRIKVWQKLSEAARQQFTWPETGQILTEDKANFSLPIPPNNEPILHFFLLLFSPQKVDHLELRNQPHQRTIYYLDDNQEWKIKSVNP